MSAINADPAELQKFSELAHRWWDPASEFKPLHDINPLRLGWINGKADLLDKTVLDVGCGGGILAESMAVQGAEVTGIDLSEKALGVARLLCRSDKDAGIHALMGSKLRGQLKRRIGPPDRQAEA